jgi:malate dehydrogenase (oxaloacetate-decarboxylating)
MKKVTVEELLAKAAQPAKDAPRLHKFYKGKMGVALHCRVRDFNDFAIWYTPGVAAVCKEIAADKQKVYEGNARRVFPRLDAALKAKGK